VKIARVSGTVVSTINHPLFDDHRLLMCDYLDEAGAATGDYAIAVDLVGAGAGEDVLVLDEGNSARQTLDVDTGPAPTSRPAANASSTLAVSPATRTRYLPGWTVPAYAVATGPRLTMASPLTMPRAMDENSRRPMAGFAIRRSASSRRR